MLRYRPPVVSLGSGAPALAAAIRASERGLLALEGLPVAAGDFLGQVREAMDWLAGGEGGEDAAARLNKAYAANLVYKVGVVK